MDGKAGSVDKLAGKLCLQVPQAGESVTGTFFGFKKLIEGA